MRTIYQHYKGGIYVKLHQAKWHEAGQYENGPANFYVVYQQLREPYSVFVRPLLEFDGFIDEENLVRRFRPIGQVPG